MPSNNTVCPYCNTTKEEFVKDGLLGCSHCYQTFSAVIGPWLNKNQSASRHCGKRALSALSESGFNQYKSLSELLEVALYSEDYAQSRKIKSQLDEIRKG